MKPSMFIATSTEGLPVGRAVQQELEHDVYATLWTQSVFQLSGYAIDSLLQVLSGSDFGVFAFTPDDVIRIRHKQYDAVRDNVLFELGLFMGRLGKDRTFILAPRGNEKLHIPTDLFGLTTGTYDPDRPDKNLVAALGSACNQIRHSIQKLGPIRLGTQQAIEKLDEKALNLILRFGNQSVFTGFPPGTVTFGGIDSGTIENGGKTLIGLGMLRFEPNLSGGPHQYHWTEFGKEVIKALQDRKH
jgi:hypothetical protein